MLRRHQRARPNAVECAGCGATDAIQIELELPDETRVEFSSCHRCEHRWWTCDGAVIDLGAVLERVRQA
jgi:DNA-directed RNA polymerase subunit M/transcription elongation factor TFIIS